MTTQQGAHHNIKDLHFWCPDITKKSIFVTLQALIFHLVILQHEQSHNIREPPNLVLDHMMALNLVALLAIKNLLPISWNCHRIGALYFGSPNHTIDGHMASQNSFDCTLLHTFATYVKIWVSFKTHHVGVFYHWNDEGSSHFINVGFWWHIYL